MAAELPIVLWQQVLTFETRASSLCALAGCCRSFAAVAADAWGGLAAAVVGASRLLASPVFGDRAAVRSLRALRELLMEAVLAEAPQSTWPGEGGEAEGTQRPEGLPRGQAPMVAGSYALWAYLTKVLRRQVAWTPNDIDLWFPNRGNVEWLATTTAAALERRLPLRVRIRRPSAAHDYCRFNAAPPPPSGSRWTGEFEGYSGPWPLTAEHLRGGRCVVAHVLDLEYALRTAPDEPLGKLSFIGTCAGRVGSFHWRQQPTEPPLTHAEILARFDIDVCRLGFFPGTQAFCVPEAAVLARHLATGTAVQLHFGADADRAAARRAKYERRGFAFPGGKKS